ncbi:MAG: signal transduction histidine kinase/FixJ family two-component response regulator [Urechidicola sp.]|jgi:signal transduction histidine kinase/FixJ family two-component response regulator
MKKLPLFLLLIPFALSGQKSINSAAVTAYKTALTEIGENLKNKPLNASRITLEKFILDIEALQNNNAATTKDEIIAVNNLYAHAVFILCGSIYVPLREYELVKEYHAILMQTAPIDSYWLGRIEGIMSWIYSDIENDEIATIISFKKALDYFNTSTHKSKSNRKINMLLGLINNFINYRLTAKAIELLPVLEFEINLIDKKKISNYILLDFKILEIRILIEQNKNEEALKKLNTLHLDQIENQSGLINNYYSVRAICADLKMPELFLKYHKKVLKHPEFKTLPFYSTDESFGYFIYYLVINDLKNATKYFNIFEKERTLKNTKNSFKQEPIDQKILAEYYNKMNNYKLAFKYQKEAFIIADSLYNARTALLNKLNLYDLVLNKDLTKLKSEYQIKEKTNEYEQKQLIYIAVIISISLIFLFSILLYYRWQKQLKASLELTKTKEQLSYKNNFLENISHEMRTPLTVIIGYLSLIQTKTFDVKKILLYSSEGIRNSEQLIASLNNFLKIAQLEQQEAVKNIFTSKKAHMFFVDIVNSFLPSASLKNMKVYFSSNIKKNIAITYQYETLKKITENLIANALKYSDSKTSIYITCTIDAKHIVLTVRDEGIGIAKKDQDKVFDKFYQSKQHAVTGGFGIGLSLVNELVKSLKGSIKLTSEQNLGSVFTIELPHHLKNFTLLTDSVSPAFTLLTIEENIKEISNNKYPKALIVDDNLEMIGYYKELLSSSLDCFFAFNGKEALEMIKKQEIDIIISDYRMPIVDGIDFKTMLNKEDIYKNIPFLLVTAIPTIDIENDPNILIGIQDYIVKPFDRHELLSRIKTLLQKTIHRKKLFSAKEDEVELNNHFTDLMQKIKSIVIANLNNADFSIKILAQECGYEQKQLNRILQSKIGMSSVQIIIEIRLLKAYDFILNNSHATLNELMYAVGFNSRPHFNKKFYERFGIKVGELKKKYS